MKKHANIAILEGYNLKENNMKKVIIAVSLFISLLTVSSITFIHFKNQEVSVTNKVNDRKLNIALVNEDMGGKLQGESYNFGSDFTTLLSKDSTNQWTVMSRNIAENRFEDGSIDVIVYIEQQFSEKIVQLESFNPSKAKITYKTKSNLDSAKAKNVELKVGEYLNLINQNVIKMYFSSVINNLDDAKRNVENVVNEQSGAYTKISQTIYPYSSDAMQSIVGVADFTTSLQKNNNSFEEAQKQFSDSVVSLLDTTGTDLNKQVTEVKSHFDAKKEVDAKNISEMLEILKAQQKESDIQASIFNQKILEDLNKLGPLSVSLDNSTDLKLNEESKSESELDKLANLVKDYNRTVGDYKNNIEARKKELEERVTELKEERKTISNNYFGQELPKDKLNDDKFLIAQAKKVLANQIDNSLRKNNLPKEFTNMIDNELAGTNIDPASYEPLFDKLKTINALSDAEINTYKAQMSLLADYARINGATTNQAPAFEFVKVTNDQLIQKNGDIPITVQLPQPTIKTSSPAVTPGSSSSVAPSGSSQTASGASSGTAVTTNSVSGQTVASSTSGTVQYETPKAQVFITDIATNTSDLSLTLDGGAQEISDAAPHQLRISYSFTPKYGENTISFTLHIGDTKIPITKTIYVSNKEEEYELVKKDLKTILQYLGRIERASSMVQAIYGVPSNLGNMTVNIASPDSTSVYSMYGNISRNDIASQLLDTQVESFKESGKKLLEEIDLTISKQEKSLTDMPKLGASEDKDENLYLPNNYFKDRLTALSDWYTNAKGSLESEYQSWKDLQTKQSTNIVNKETANGVALENSEKASNQIYTSIEALVTTTQNSAKETSKNHEALGTIKPQFEHLLSQVQAVKENIDKTASTTNELIVNEATVIQENRLYSNNFKELMKNARNGGITNQNVMNFLSQPIEVKKESKTIAISPENNQFWIILAIIGSSVFSILITFWLTKAKYKN